MIGRAHSDGGSFPCFDLLIGWLLWGMRNARDEEAFEPRDSLH